ncbi:MAG: hypothetical protein ACKO96_18750, partial [Flammeovirgaceae bacterium]
MPIITPSIVKTHHILQQNLVDHPLIRLIGGRTWIESTANKLHLTNKLDVAIATGTPLHLSNHSWIENAQRARLDEYFLNIENRVFGNLTGRQLLADPGLNPLAYAEMKAAATSFADDLRDITGKGILNGDLFLTSTDPRAVGIDVRAQADNYLSAQRFSSSTSATQARAADLVTFRADRAALEAAGVDARWRAFDTPAKARALFESSAELGGKPYNTAGASSTSLARYAAHIDDGTISAYVANTPAAKALPSRLLSRLGVG